MKKIQNSKFKIQNYLSTLSSRPKGNSKFKNFRNILNPKPYTLYPNLGFTLIELVVAMMIIATLATALWGNFFTSLSKGKDSRRKQDLESVARALELYYNDSRAYPNPTVPLPSWGTAFVNLGNTAVIYMQQLPSDPAYPNSSYCYTSDEVGTYYKLYANLENKQDPKIFVTPVLCNGVYYNYGISSPNTTP